MDIKTAHKLLGARGSHPTTPAGMNKRLEAIAAGRGLHKPTAAHPYFECFSRTDRYGSTRDHTHNGPRVSGGTRYEELYGPRISCAEYIAQCEADKIERRATA